MALVSFAFIEPDRDADCEMIAYRGYFALQGCFILYAIYCRRRELSKMMRMPEENDKPPKMLCLNDRHEKVSEANGILKCIACKGQHYFDPNAPAAKAPVAAAEPASGSFL